jgi:hypothetical protein
LTGRTKCLFARQLRRRDAIHAPVSKVVEAVSGGRIAVVGPSIVLPLVRLHLVLKGTTDFLATDLKLGSMSNT